MAYGQLDFTRRAGMGMLHDVVQHFGQHQLCRAPVAGRQRRKGASAEQFVQRGADRGGIGGKDEPDDRRRALIRHRASRRALGMDDEDAVHRVRRKTLSTGGVNPASSSTRSGPSSLRTATTAPSPLESRKVTAERSRMTRVAGVCTTSRIRSLNWIATAASIRGSRRARSARHHAVQPEVACPIPACGTKTSAVLLAKRNRRPFRPPPGGFIFRPCPHAGEPMDYDSLATSLRALTRARRTQSR